MDKETDSEEWDFDVFSVIKHYTKAGQTYSILRCPDWVNVIALTRDGRFVLVQQHRFGTQSESLEFPGGIVEKGQLPLQAAIEELREETGFESSDWYHLGSYQANPGLQNNQVHSFICKGAYESSTCAEAGVRAVLLAPQELASALYEHGGPLQQAFALASIHLAVRRGHIEVPAGLGPDGR